MRTNIPKDFDEWNQKKKVVDFHAKRRFYHVREIWWCSLGVNVGFEENGTGDEYHRPVLILQGLSRETCLVVPLTTSPHLHKYRVSVGLIGGKSAQAIMSQMRVIDTKRLTNRIEVLDKSTFHTIRKSIIEIL